MPTQPEVPEPIIFDFGHFLSGERNA